MCERVELGIGRGGGRVRFLHLIIFKAYIPILYLFIVILIIIISLLL